VLHTQTNACIIIMSGCRDPHPFPRLQNDDDFMGDNKIKSHQYKNSTETEQKQDPWNRLFNKPTLASHRRQIHHFDVEAPHDSLDFVIKANYNHHTEFMRGVNETLKQTETITEDHGRILKNRAKEVVPEHDPLTPPLKVWSDGVKTCIHAVDGAIPSHHSAATNRGYSRRHDGGFYSI